MREFRGDARETSEATQQPYILLADSAAVTFTTVSGLTIVLTAIVVPAATLVDDGPYRTNALHLHRFVFFLHLIHLLS